jgi:hypothetical protein
LIVVLRIAYRREILPNKHKLHATTTKWKIPWNSPNKDSSILKGKQLQESRWVCCNPAHRNACVRSNLSTPLSQTMQNNKIKNALKLTKWRLFNPLGKRFPAMRVILLCSCASRCRSQIQPINATIANYAKQ